MQSELFINGWEGGRNTDEKDLLKLKQKICWHQLFPYGWTSVDTKDILLLDVNTSWFFLVDK